MLNAGSFSAPIWCFSRHLIAAAIALLGCTRHAAAQCEGYAYLIDWNGTTTPSQLPCDFYVQLIGSDAPGSQLLQLHGVAAFYHFENGPPLAVDLDVSLVQAPSVYSSVWSGHAPCVSGAISATLIPGVISCRCVGTTVCPITRGGSLIETLCGGQPTTPCERRVCVADIDDGRGLGIADGGVDLEDLIYFLRAFREGGMVADLSTSGDDCLSDGGVDINDLLFFLTRFEYGC